MRLIKLGTVDDPADMYDEYVDTQTETATQISDSFDVSDYNCVMCLNNYGTDMTLEVVDNDLVSTYYSESVSLILDSIKDWWDYFFAPVRIGRDTIFYFDDRSNATATITINYSGGTAKCGMCLPGTAYEMGDTQPGIKVGITDYSIIDTSDFGNTYFSQGNWAKRLEADIMVANTSHDANQRKAVAIRKTAAGFDFNNYTDAISDGHTSVDGYQALVVYGFIEDYDPPFKHGRHNVAHVEVQGLI